MPMLVIGVHYYQQIIPMRTFNRQQGIHLRSQTRPQTTEAAIVNSIVAFLNSIVAFLNSIVAFLNSIVAFLNSIVAFLNSIAAFLNSIKTYVVAWQG
jgi:hypothetical protein